VVWFSFGVSDEVKLRGLRVRGVMGLYFGWMVVVCVAFSKLKEQSENRNTSCCSSPHVLVLFAVKPPVKKEL
jgi:hypothetical protein